MTQFPDIVTLAARFERSARPATRSAPLVFDAGQNSPTTRPHRELAVHFVGVSSRPTTATCSPSPTPLPGRRRLRSGCHLLRPHRPSSVSTAGSWSPTPRTCTTSSPRVRSNPGQSPPASPRARCPSRPGPHPPAPTRRRSRDRPDPATPWSRGHRPPLTGDDPADLRLTWRTNPTARRRSKNELFGKRILFTDKNDARRATSSPTTAPKTPSRTTSAK